MELSYGACTIMIAHPQKDYSRDSALALLTEYTSSDSLRKHALTVEAAMVWYADYFQISADEKILWGVTGLLHDFDYEKHPDPTPETGHPFVGVTILRDLGWPEVMCEAILGHAQYSGVPRTTLMAKALFAVDRVRGGD
jgi:predicted hydrolase (HD superfamily)